MKKNILLTLMALMCAMYGKGSFYDVKIGDLYYDLHSYSGNTATVTSPSSSSEKYSGDIVIPSSVTYEGTTYSVTEIGGAFYRCTDITSVTIPGSIINIEYSYSYWGTFEGCTGLISVVIGDGVQQIGGKAFYGCTSLTSVTIPNSVTTIGASAFKGCTALVSITIPNSVTSIGEETCSGCTGLTSITIPNSVTSIDSYAFYGCTGLTSVTIPNSVTKLGYCAFQGCTNLASAKISDNLKTIEYGTFKGCSRLASVIIGCNVTEIENAYDSNGGAFEDCSSLLSIDFPTSMTYIGGNALKGCKSLTSLTIPDNITEIGTAAFEDCSRIMTLSLGNGIKAIKSSAFYNCTRLTQVYYQGSLSEWCNIEFGYSSSNPLCNGGKLYIDNQLVTDVSIPNTITAIKPYAFSNYSFLASVIIPSSVKTIYVGAFEYCTGLVSITIPNSVTSIKNSAFSGCTGLTSVTIPNSVTSIEAQAFDNCIGLTSMTIPNSVTSIESNAFRNCEGLTSLTIGNSVVSIGKNAFSHCTGLTAVVIPNSVTEMGEGAFEQCTNLESVVISDNLVAIEVKTFNRCYNLSSVTFGKNIREIGKNTSIYSREGAFEGCSKLTAITIPNSVTKIGYHSFYRCSLKYVTIGTGIQEIEDRCFDYDSSEETLVTIKATIPPAIQEKTFSKQTILYVPCEAKDLYQAASDWKDYKDQIYGLSYDVNLSATEGGFAKITSSDCSSNTITIEATTQSTESYEFVRWSDGNTENPRTMTMTEDINLTAEFSTRTYTISVTCDPQQGKVTGGGEYTYHTDVTIEAIPNEGYEFDYWDVNGSHWGDNPLQIWVSENQTFRAIFKEREHTITVTCNPQQGNVIGGGTYADGAQVTLVAIANKGYEFAQWSNGITDNPYLLTATADLTLEAQFIPATAVENVSADGTTPQKIVRDGQVYILRNGKTYTTTGVEVK